MAKDLIVFSRRQALENVPEYVMKNSVTLAGIGQDARIFQERVTEAMRPLAIIDKVEKESLFSVIHNMCATGLVPDGVESAIIPYTNDATKISTLKLIPMWKGYAKLGMENLNGEIHRGIVTESDIVTMIQGINVAPMLKIESKPFQGKKKMAGVWASIHIHGNEYIRAEEHPRYVILEIEDIEAAKMRSQSVKKGKKDSPWFTDYEAMALKTAIRRLISPLSYMFLTLPARHGAIRAAMQLDDEFDRLENGNIIDVTPPKESNPEVEERPKRRPRSKPAGKAAPEQEANLENPSKQQQDAAPAQAPPQESDASLMAEQDAPEIDLRVDDDGEFSL